MSKIQAIVNNNKLLYLLLALFSLLLACLSKDYDYDLYARLIVGEHFFTTGWISYKDFLSYTPTHTWYDHEWGASLVFYAFLKLFGPFGLILVQAITSFITTLFIIKTQRLQQHCYPISICFISSFMLLFSHQNPSIVRCHMFSFMFFSILLYVLEKTRKQDSKILWLLPLMILVWNNIHGGVVSGMGIIFIYMVCEFLSRKSWKKYFVVLLISTPLLAINPYGVEYLSFLLSANTKNRMYITEWWNVFAQRHVFYYFPLYIVGVFSSGLYLLKIAEKRKVDITKMVVLIVTLILGILHVKLLSLTLITVAALFYNEIVSFLSKNGIRLLNRLTLVFTLSSILYIPFTEPTVARTDWQKYPVQEVEFIKQNNIKGNLLSMFGLSSYISYKLYPQNLIYMDGRYEEVYYDREFDKLGAFELVLENWMDVLKEYPTEILILHKGSLIDSKIRELGSWKEVFSGKYYSVLVKRELAKKDASYKKPSEDLRYYQEYEFERFG